MTVVSNLNAYSNSLKVYAQNNLSAEQQNLLNAKRLVLGNLSNGAGRSGQTQNVLNLLSQQTYSAQGTSLTEQISSLLQLTRYAMDSMGLEANSRVTFTQLKNYCTQVQDRFSTAVQDGLVALAVDPENVTYTLDPLGKMTAHSPSPLNEALAQLGVDESARQVEALSEGLEQAGVNLSSGFSFSLAADGSISPHGESSVYEDLLAEAKLSFPTLATNILTQGVDPEVDFSLKNTDDLVRVNCSDEKYTEVLQAFFDENPSIVADYKRTEALSGIEDIRRFMRLSPREMRTRLQLENLAAWWDTSGQASATSSFGMFNGGVYSRLNGVNLSV